MSKPSRLVRPSSAGAASKLPSARKEYFGSRSKTISLGEKLLRAGSEGNLVKHKAQQQVQMEEVVPSRRNTPPKEQAKSNLRVTSPEDAEHLSKKQSVANGSNRTDPKPSRNIPRRHTVGGPRSSKEILGMQPSDMDKKREAFLEHLKQKYPHHASAIMGHQERLREQSRSPKHSQSPQPGAGEQAEHLLVALTESVEAMSEGEAPAAFARGSRTRASLPVVRSTNQTKDRSLGVLYLQYGDETKQIRMPNEITTTDTIRALFVSAFPQQLTMKMLDSPNVAVYIKDDVRNMYYELTDMRSITDHSCLKVYHKDPAHAFSHNSRPANGDVRMHREILYATREGQHTMRQAMGPPPPHAIQSPIPPPNAHSMPPSPSRIPYGPRAMVMAGSATIPRDRLPSVPPSRSISPCPSAILERRDVKPDEDLGNKNVALLRSEGLYADPYMLHEARLSIASSHSGHPGDMVDHSMGYARGSRAAGSYATATMTTEMMEHQTLYRQKSRKYGDSHLPTLGSKTPPPSPHRMGGDVRLIDIHTGQAPHVPPQTVQLERSSPVRLSFKKDAGNSVALETVTKTRSNMASPVIPDVPLGHGDKSVPGHGLPASPNDPQTRERMKAMEQQLASLTGLVQSALLKGPNASGAKEASSEKNVKTASPPVHSTHGGVVSSTPAVKSTVVTVETSAVNTLPPPSSPTPVQVNLINFRRNVSDLRLQLHQMRQLQLQNQEALRLMLKRAEQEISGKVAETVRRLEDPVQRQRVMVEEERQKYLAMEEKILMKLCDLERYVDSLKKDSSSITVHRAVTLKDVEEGAVSLRKVGESLAGLKGEFPTLQNKMRAVLRVEVEAVKFLKEEPHKLDSMLKRVKTLTEILSGLRRSTSENLLKGSDPAQGKTTTTETIVAFTESESPSAVAISAQEQPNSPTALPEPQSSSIKSEVMPTSPVVIHHVQSSPVHIHQSQHSAVLVHHSNSPPVTPTQGPDAPVLVQSNAESMEQSQETSSVLQVQKPLQNQEHAAPASTAVTNNGGTTQSLFIEEIHTSRSKTRNRVLSIEAAEKEWEEKRQNIGHYDGNEFEKLLQEAQANMMKGIPNLEVVEAEAPPVPPPPHQDEVDTPHTLEQLAGDETPHTEPSIEKATKSPPPPPPRRSYPPGSGLTTGRSGEVIFTSRKETVIAQAEGEEEGTPAPHAKPTRSPSESKVSQTPPPIAASAIQEEEDDGDRIMAELQQNMEMLGEERQSDKMDENGNDTVLQSPGVIYYVTAQISKEHASADMEDQRERRETHTETTVSSSQVANVNAYEISESLQQFVTNELPVLSVLESQENDPHTSPQMQIVYTEYHQEDPEVTTEAVDIQPMGIPVQKEQVAVTMSHQLSADEQAVTLCFQEGVPHNGAMVVAGGLLVTSTVIIQDASPTVESSHEGAESGYSQQIVMRSSQGRVVEEADTNCSSLCEEGPSPTDNIAFMITDTKVQALSCGEYEEIVNSKGENVQTVKVEDNREMTTQDNNFDKKPVIIIFDEPMDIRSAYKRLSTIFECEEELERMLAEERIEEENEEAEEADIERKDLSVEAGVNEADNTGYVSNAQSFAYSSGAVTQEDSRLEEPSPGLMAEQTESVNDGKQDGKKKFKFKFPKKQLAALTQAIRTGTKTGKKTLQVVVYEEEEEPDGTVKQQKEAKRFEINRSKSKADSVTTITTSSSSSSSSTKTVTSGQQSSSDSQYRTDEIRKNTYKTLDSLEQTIKQLETTISEMGPRSPDDAAHEESKAYSLQGAGSVDKRSAHELDSMSEPAAPVYHSHKPAHRKKPKPQLLPRPAAVPSSPSEQSTSVTTSTSRMPVPLSAKTRQQPGGTDKAGKPQKLQDPQRQFRQANGSAKKAGGDNKATSPTLPASKIPAFSPSSGKSSTLSASSSDATNPINSSSSKSSIPSPSLLPPHTGRPAPHHPATSSHIPSLSNGSLRLPSPTHTGKGQNLSFSPQTQNGRPPPSSSYSPSSSSPISPVSLSHGAKSIRTIHTPSFISYKPQNGNSSKATQPPASSAKDTA
ncbi:sickle tail protein homolog isoform X4 [Amia ocellicauda]|uniref:sickle tail protein homolog isoform X4 n=1 Tax=Amia ocellicauda TaxID=2972642 RepID=UPI003464D2E1